VASHVIEVAFKGNRREFYLWETDDIPPVQSAVIVEADRGEDLGYVHAIGELALKRNRGTSHGGGAENPTRRARRLASSDEVRKHTELRTQDEQARRKAMERVRANALQMKVSDAEWQWDRKKLTFYFTADKRVDFRTLVRELAATFRTRIELKQIGVRDEAKRLDGIGRCGRQYCSASWLPELRPVSLGVAKDQRLSLNPTQISGACGRLMCSLRYEHEFYVQARRKFPKEGKTVRTAMGEERVVSNDIFRERVVLRHVEGETRTVTLAQLLQEIEAVGGTITPAMADRGDRRDVPTPSAVREAASLSRSAPVDDDVEGVVEDDEDATQPRSREPDVVDAASASGAAAPRQPAEPSDRADRRPHRRRGRRGGRRNRGGRRDEDSGQSGEPGTPRGPSGDSQ
jgi:cell fate regulator YaaT (PSP1 superfamily)